MTTDLTETRVMLVDAHPATVLEALERLELSRPATEAVQALGLADRMTVAPGGLVWQVGRGHVHVAWDVRVEAGGEHGAVISSTTRFVASDEAARERLRTAWGLVGAVSTALSTRALTTIKRYAEERDDVAPSRAVLRLAA